MSTSEQKKYPKNFLVSYAAMEAGYLKLTPTQLRDALENGADANARDDYGKTPLMFAKTAAQMAMLKRYNADINAVDNKNQSVLHHASSVETVAFLVSREELDPYIRDAWQQTALDWKRWSLERACAEKQLEIRQMVRLISHKSVNVASRCREFDGVGIS